MVVKRRATAIRLNFIWGRGFDIDIIKICDTTFFKFLTVTYDSNLDLGAPITIKDTRE